MTLRLALVVPALGQGGGVTSVARFVKDVALSDPSIQLQLVSLSTSAFAPESLRLSSPRSWVRGPMATEGMWEGLPFVSVGAVAGELEFQRYQPRALLKDVLAGCDVVQVVCGSPAWACAVTQTGKPIAVQVATLAKVERRRRDQQARGLLGHWRKAMTRITDRLDHRALTSAHAIQVENPWMLEHVTRINQGRKVDIRYAPPGVDARTFKPSRRSASNGGGPRYILCVGRLGDARKNIGLLLEAYSRMSATLRDQVGLLLAGSGSPPPAFWARVEELGLGSRVTFIHRPPQDELVRLYQGADVFVLPSDEEGLGVVLLEAMACATPVISTRSGGPDGIITDGVDGYLTQLDNAEELAVRLAEILRDRGLAVRMGAAGRATIERRYAAEIAGAAFLDVWRKLAQHG